MYVSCHGERERESDEVQDSVSFDESGVEWRRSKSGTENEEKMEKMRMPRWNYENGTK